MKSFIIWQKIDKCIGVLLQSEELYADDQSSNADALPYIAEFMNNHTGCPRYGPSENIVRIAPSPVNLEPDNPLKWLLKFNDDESSRSFAFMTEAGVIVTRIFTRTENVQRGGSTEYKLINIEGITHSLNTLQDVITALHTSQWATQDTDTAIKLYERVPAVILYSGDQLADPLSQFLASYLPDDRNIIVQTSQNSWQFHVDPNRDSEAFRQHDTDGVIFIQSGAATIWTRSNKNINIDPRITDAFFFRNVHSSTSENSSNAYSEDSSGEEQSDDGSRRSSRSRSNEASLHTQESDNSSRRNSLAESSDTRSSGSRNLTAQSSTLEWYLIRLKQNITDPSELQSIIEDTVWNDITTADIVYPARRDEYLNYLNYKLQQGVHEMRHEVKHWLDTFDENGIFKLVRAPVRTACPAHWLVSNSFDFGFISAATSGALITVFKDQHNASTLVSIFGLKDELYTGRDIQAKMANLNAAGDMCFIIDQELSNDTREFTENRFSTALLEFARRYEYNIAQEGNDLWRIEAVGHGSRLADFTHLQGDTGRRFSAIMSEIIIGPVEQENTETEDKHASEHTVYHHSFVITLSDNKAHLWCRTRRRAVLYDTEVDNFFKDVTINWTNIIVITHINTPEDLIGHLENQDWTDLWESLIVYPTDKDQRDAWVQHVTASSRTNSEGSFDTTTEDAHNNA